MMMPVVGSLLIIVIVWYLCRPRSYGWTSAAFWSKADTRRRLKDEQRRERA